MVTTKQKMFEVRWHARGGQGAVTASRFLSTAGVRERKHFQAFPEFGTERMGAPIQAFTRISPERIYLHSQVQTPDAVVVLDPTLLRGVDVTAGLQDGGTLVVNSPDDPATVRKQINAEGKNITVFTVDADKIARECIGRPITNTAMVGALVRATGLLEFDNVREELRAQFGHRFRQSVVDGNIRALERAYEEVVSE
ncbi:MAG: 2-oxoacid:acceptor oxidoreductase family protein [Dehalococcoidales bacterium]|nr:2-oxoacid:acceptor oxidoreductase family protein [Dehalococcoidales bacterium]